MAAMFSLIDQNKQMAQETGRDERSRTSREALDMASTQISLEKLIQVVRPRMLSAPNIPGDYLQGLISQAIRGVSASLEHEP